MTLKEIVEAFDGKEKGTSRSTSYLGFLRETILDSNKQEFNNAVETICTRIKSLQYYIILLIITQMIISRKLLI